MKKKTLFKRILIMIVIIAIVVAGVYLYRNSIFGSKVEEEFVFDSDVLMEEILEIGELATIEYRYTNTGSLESWKKLFDTEIAIPGTKKEALISMDGALKVGVDVKDIKISTNEVSKSIIISIPQAKVISNELDETSLQVYSEKDALFNKITLSDDSQIRQQIKDNAYSNAVKSGIMKQAQENAGKIIQLMLEAIPKLKDTYTITIRYS